MTQSIREPPTDGLEPSASTLNERSGRERRTIVHSAQQCLREQPPRTSAIDAREGEWVVQIDDQRGE